MLLGVQSNVFYLMHMKSSKYQLAKESANVSYKIGLSDQWSIYDVKTT